MTNKKHLLLIIPMMAISLMSVQQYASAQNTSANTTANDLFVDFRSDIHDLVFAGNYTWEQAKEIQYLHDAELEQIINQIEIGNNDRMDPQSKEAFKEYMLVEELKYQQGLLDDTRVIDSSPGQEIETNDPELFGYFFPSAFADVTNNLSSFFSDSLQLISQVANMVDIHLKETMP